MIRDLLSNTDLAFWPCVSLVLFVASFAAITVRAYSRSRAGEMARAGRIPLDDERTRP